MSELSDDVAISPTLDREPASEARAVRQMRDTLVTFSRRWRGIEKLELEYNEAITALIRVAQVLQEQAR